MIANEMFDQQNSKKLFEYLINRKLTEIKCVLNHSTMLVICKSYFVQHYDLNYAQIETLAWFRT